MFELLEDAGVNKVLISTEEKTVVVFSNNMVDPVKYAGVDLYEITHEKVRKNILDEILEEASGDLDSIKSRA